MIEHFIFRDIRPEEADQAILLEEICFPPHEQCSPEDIRSRIEKAPELFLVAEDPGTGRIAGFLCGIATNETRFRDAFFTDSNLHDPNGRNIMLTGLNVGPAYRMQGLARTLMATYLQRESLRPVRREMAVLTCLEEKVPMYTRMGFTDKGMSASVWGGEPWHEMTCPIR